MPLIDKVLSLIWPRRLKSPDHGDNKLISDFRALLSNRLNAVAPKLTRSFRTLTQTNAPAALTTLHFEVFTDDLSPDFRLFGLDENNTEVFYPALAAFNDDVEKHLPLLAREEVEPFIVFENDPKWGKQEAINQPLDNFDLGKIMSHFFKSITQQCHTDYEGKITFGFHDGLQPIEV